MKMQNLNAPMISRGSSAANAGLSLGIDTSCYTTSIAVVDAQGRLIADERRLLSVQKGSRGLRQSEALFQNKKNVPDLIKEIKPKVRFSDIKTVSVSTKPRPAEGSYMPVFVGGSGFAGVIADMLQVPLKCFTHQEGHIMAGIWAANAGHLMEKAFLSFHISGGTTELLYVDNTEDGFAIDIIGGSKDLHAGQFIDRVGVSLGLPFPCGPHLEEMALEATEHPILPVSTHETWIHFSGPETHTQRLISGKDQREYPQIALGVLKCITDSTARVIEEAMKQTGRKDVLMVGGVCSNSIMKRLLLDQFKDRANIYFARPAFATDNAVGTALLGIWRSQNE